MGDAGSVGQHYARSVRGGRTPETAGFGILTEYLVFAADVMRALQVAETLAQSFEGRYAGAAQTLTGKAPTEAEARAGECPPA